MTKKHWDPYRRQEPVQPKQRSDFWLPNLIPAAAQESIEMPDQVTLEIKPTKAPVVPRRPGVFQTWKDRQRDSIDQAVVMGVGWILGVTYVTAGVAAGLAIAYGYEIAYLVLFGARSG